MLAASVARGSEPDAAMVVVHAPAALLDLRRADDDGTVPNATINGEAITDTALHRLLCDTRIEISFDTPDGRTIGVGRATRNPPAPIRRRVRGRDGGRCRWAGCGRPIRHIHHMIHWTRGGPADACNLFGVCWHHHHLLHEGGWDASGDADSEVIFTSPHGRTLRSRAGPLAA